MCLFYFIVTRRDAIHPFLFPFSELIVKALLEGIVYARTGHVTPTHTHEPTAQVLDVDMALILHLVLGKARTCTQLGVFFSKNGTQIVHRICAGNFAAT